MQKKIRISTKGNFDIVDITDKVIEIVEESGTKDGICVVFVSGSTASITINENDKDLITDFKHMIEKLIPENQNYRHSSNPFSHLRAWLLGAEKTIPITNNELQLGTWQSIFLVDFDVLPRTREVFVKVFGD